MEYLHKPSGIIPPAEGCGIFQHGVFKTLMESTQERVRNFMSKLGHREVSEATGIKEERCKTIRYDKRANLRTNELDLIAAHYPQYSLWLRTGRIDPGRGETSPDYDEANRNLTNPHVG